jgi:hypothetical protein
MTNQWPSLGPATVLATCAVHGDIQFDARRVVVLLDRTPVGALYPCDLCGHARLVPIGGVSTAVLIGGGAQVVKPLSDFVAGRAVSSGWAGGRSKGFRLRPRRSGAGRRGRSFRVARAAGGLPPRRCRRSVPW